MIYKQTRLGRHGKPFVIYKFRTMPKDAERSGAVYPVSNDPRATRVGRLLRKHALDELPQVWNVLRGDMALVGPRPERPEIYEAMYPANWRERLAVKPGLAGHAQRIGATTPAMKLEADLWYIAHRSFWLDMQILAACIIKAVKGRW